MPRRYKANEMLCNLPLMARWIGIDYGLARTGLAITDNQAMMAFPHETVPTSGLWEALESLVLAEPCAGFALGMPDAWELKSSSTDSTAAIHSFQKQLKKKWPNLAVHIVDESFTSREARQAMVIGGMKKKKREVKGAMDRIAAAQILQRFLETL